MKRPQHIGILAISVYIPKAYVKAAALEEFDGVSTGKYTIGLGQEAVAICGPHEDPISMALNAAQGLLTDHEIPPSRIGRVDVGSESNPDRSKSIKSHIMRLLASNSNVLGSDCVHACYGGTAALLNAVQWVDSSLWDGRLAMVVTSDIAAYAPGPARPTGGAASVALLVGPDAPLELLPHSVTSYSDSCTEFCKPAGLYPVFDGPATVAQYLRALDNCSKALRRRWSPTSNAVDTCDVPTTQASTLASTSCGHCSPSQPCGCNAYCTPPSSQQHSCAGPGSVAPGAAADVSGSALLQSIDHVVFHSPYNKMVQKAWLRLLQCNAAAYVQAGREQECRQPDAAARPNNPPTAAAMPSCSATRTAATGQSGQQQPMPAVPAVCQAECSHGTGKASPAGNVCTVHVAAQNAAPLYDSLQNTLPSSAPQPAPPPTLCQTLTSSTAQLPANAPAAHYPQPQPSVATVGTPAGAPAGAGLGSGHTSARVRSSAGALEHPLWHSQVAPGAAAQRAVGNCYCASVYLGLACLVQQQGAKLQGKHILLFSFGSGVCSSMFVLRGREPPARGMERNGGHFSLTTMASKVHILEQLATRQEVHPSVMAHYLQLQESRYSGDFRPLQAVLSASSAADAGSAHGTGGPWCSEGTEGHGVQRSSGAHIPAAAHPPAQQQQSALWVLASLDEAGRATYMQRC